MHPTSDIPKFDPERILFHGNALLVVDKPAGIPVHYGTGHPYGLVEMLAAWVTENPGILDTRPGKRIHPVHRLDLEASGVLILALSRAAARRTKEAFAKGTVRKRYLAVVSGPVPEEGELHGTVRSKLRGVYRQVPASLTFRRLRGDERLSLVEVEPHGGRTHQIRALFARHSRPLAGDLRYGKEKPARLFLERFGLEYLLLHAREIILPPGPLDKEMRFEAPLPEAFRKLVEAKGWDPLE